MGPHVAYRMKEENKHPMRHTFAVVKCFQLTISPSTMRSCSLRFKILGTFRTPRTDTKRMLIRHLGSRIRQSPCGELVFTNGSLFIRGTLRIRQVHIYLDRYTCFARYTFFP